MFVNNSMHLGRSPWRSRRRRSGGAVTIELIVVLPLLLIALLAVAQFGYFFHRIQQLALASRVGAEEASQTASLPNSGTVPTNIANAINHQLLSSNISTVAIIVEHNTTGSEQVLRTNFVANTCPEPTAVLPASTTRVTVCVPLRDLMPNCLAIFGFDISSRNAAHTTTFGYEL